MQLEQQANLDDKVPKGLKEALVRQAAVGHSDRWAKLEVLVVKDQGCLEVKVLLVHRDLLAPLVQGEILEIMELRVASVQPDLQVL